MFISKAFEYTEKPRKCEAVPWYSKGRFQSSWLLFSLVGWMALYSGTAFGGSSQTQSKIIHKVAAKETIYGIARKYNISPHDLKIANGLRKDKILVGQALTIPVDAGGSKSKPADKPVPKPKPAAQPDNGTTAGTKANSGAEVASGTGITPSAAIPEGSGNEQQSGSSDAAQPGGETIAATVPATASATPKPSKQATGGAASTAAKPVVSMQEKPKASAAGGTNTKSGQSSADKFLEDPLRKGWHYRVPSSAKTQITHKVEKGDTLLDLASQYKTTVSRIMAANKLTSSVIMTGQSLKIPLPADEQVVSRSWPGNFDQNVWLLARLITGEARGEPYEGQVAVAAVALNRLMHPSFPKTLQGVIYQKGAFTAINDGQFRLRPSYTSIKAAQEALEGWDPSCGALYYYNPEKAKAKWSFLRPVVKRIGDHLFTK